MRRRHQADEAPEYPDEDRKADIRCGKRDGHKRLPTYTEVLELVQAQMDISTTYHQVLIRSGLHRINDEYQDFLRRVDGNRRRLASLRISMVMDERAVLRSKEALVVAKAELTEAELLPRSPQEIPLIGTPELHSRRIAWRDQRIATAQQELDQRVAVLENHKKEIEETSDMIDKEFAFAQACGRKIADYYLLRVATYWDAVVHTHAQGRNLTAILPPVVFPMPEWVKATHWAGDAWPPQPATADAGAGTASAGDAET